MHKNSEEISRKQLSEVLPQQDAAVSGMTRPEPVPYGHATVANVLNKLKPVTQVGYFLILQKNPEAKLRDFFIC
ncbi:hypothetical protein QE422_004010 [Chryseobacterium sp. SORGH_AS 447]|nr:hypothetical protein [Chryseobacterium sp. SORGH_AS_0447]